MRNDELLNVDFVQEELILKSFFLLSIPAFQSSYLFYWVTK